MTITVHTLVKNEARFVWFAVMSVIEHVDKVLLWDTGSTDETVEIIDAIRKTQYAKRKIEFREVGEVTPETFTDVRQQMLEETMTDWFMIVDGDEVWWDNSIGSLVELIQKKGSELESIVSPFYNVVGDIYHYQEEEAGMYEIDRRKGHINIRAVKMGIPGLHFEKPHGQLGLYGGDGNLIQGRSEGKRKFVNYPYMHFTNIPRSTSRAEDVLVPKRAAKLKYELGVSFARDFYYPEVFFIARPNIVPSPWVKRGQSYLIRAAIESPIKWMKRRIFPSSVGY